MPSRLLLLLTFVFVAAPAFGQFSGGAPDADGPVVNASRLAGSLDLDGHLQESVWGDAQGITGFLQSEPEEGDQATQRTDVRVLYDNGYIYVGAKLYDDDADKIENRLGRRDEINRADWFIVSVDSYLDRKTAFVFGVSAG